MALREWDTLEASIAELNLAKLVPLNKAIGRVCRDNGDLPAHALYFAALSVVSNSEEFFVPETLGERLMVAEKYKIVSTLAADIFALGHKPRSCADLTAFWATSGDRYFSK